MKKKIKDLTLEGVANICNKCDELEDCPFKNVLIIDCSGKFNDSIRRKGFEEEIEVDD